MNRKSITSGAAETFTSDVDVYCLNGLQFPNLKTPFGESYANVKKKKRNSKNMPRAFKCFLEKRSTF